MFRLYQLIFRLEYYLLKVIHTIGNIVVDCIYCTGVLISP